MYEGTVLPLNLFWISKVGDLFRDSVSLGVCVCSQYCFDNLSRSIILLYRLNITVKPQFVQISGAQCCESGALFKNSCSMNRIRYYLLHELIVSLPANLVSQTICGKSTLFQVHITFDQVYRSSKLIYIHNKGSRTELCYQFLAV